MPFNLTFDNLGEAAELEFGILPESHAVGGHRSVTRALPAILDLLADVPATFFVEGWNCRVYPEAIRSIVARGHEIALHGWRHELWNGLDEERERALLERGLQAFAELGIRPVGFRPPGGALTSRSGEEMRRLGFTYHSAGEQPYGRFDGLASLPFAWRHVDAYYVDPLLGPLRRTRGQGDAPLPLSSWRDAVHEAVDACIGTGGYASVIFHPYLLLEEERLAILADLLRRLGSEKSLRVVRCREVAESLAASAC